MKPIHILLIEDNEGDILLTTEAFEDGKIPVKLSVVKDGMEAIDFVNKQGRYEGADQPDLILLDVNLPKKNGLEVLKYIKYNDATKHIPVIMLTTSSSEKDISHCYRNYVNCYITKPDEADDFMKLVDIIEDFWASTVKLPVKNFATD